VADNFEAVKVSMRQNKDGYVLTLAIHPDEVPEEILRDFVGSRYAVAMIRIGDDEMPYERPKTNTYVATAGILAKDPMFQKWLDETGQVFGVSEEEAAQAICEFCQIESRSQLAVNIEAQHRLIDMRKEYEEWKRLLNEI
jgi:hypothetical protein